MPRRFLSLLIAGLRQEGWLAMVSLVLTAVAVNGQEFRIDTEVFIGSEKKPASETLTIFKNGLVYDFLLTEPREITLFDPLRGQFTLLDPSRKWKATVSTQAVLDYALDFDAHAAKSKNPLFAFAAAPAFEETVTEYEENGQKLTRLSLVGKPLEYLVIARPPDKPEAVAVFRQFADWYARLNATRTGHLPPGARIAVNKSLAERQLLPLEITRTIPASTPLGRKVEVKSKHLVNWSLSGEDHKRIDQAGVDLVTFQSVGFDEYRSAKPAAPKPATASAAKGIQR